MKNYSQKGWKRYYSSIVVSIAYSLKTMYKRKQKIRDITRFLESQRPFE